MLPPTIIATPNSANALLKPASTASITQPDASLRTAIEASISEEPKVLAKSLTSKLIDSIALVMKLTIIGVIRSACPKLIIKGVKRSPNTPSGPFLEKFKNRIRPSTTVGNPIKALNEPRTSLLPLNFFNPKTAAIGRLHTVAIATANPEIYSDRKVILYISGSKEKISWNALIIPSIIVAVT